MEWGHTEPSGPHPGSGHLATISAVKVMSAVLVGVAETCLRVAELLLLGGFGAPSSDKITVLHHFTVSQWVPGGNPLWSYQRYHFKVP